jgi:putative serine protease PepD
VITRFADQQIGSAAALLDAVRSRQPGARVAVTFTRRGVSRTVPLTLGSARSLSRARVALGWTRFPRTS